MFNNVGYFAHGKVNGLSNPIQQYFLCNGAMLGQYIIISVVVIINFRDCCSRLISLFLAMSLLKQFFFPRIFPSLLKFKQLRLSTNVYSCHAVYHRAARQETAGLSGDEHIREFVAEC